MYVDDILLTGNDSFTINKLKHHLHKVFNIKDLGLLHYNFLCLEVSYLDQGLLSLNKILLKFFFVLLVFPHLKGLLPPYLLILNFIPMILL